MLCDFNKTFGIPDYIDECLTAQDPCKGCSELKNKGNPYYEWPNCGSKCPKYCVWVFKCIDKLRYLEQRAKSQPGLDAPDTPISITCTTLEQEVNVEDRPIPTRKELDKKWTRLVKERKKKRNKKDGNN